MSCLWRFQPRKSPGEFDFGSVTGSKVGGLALGNSQGSRELDEAGASDKAKGRLMEFISAISGNHSRKLKTRR